MSSELLDIAVKTLWVTTPLTATASLVLVIVAMTTNEWLKSEERMPMKDKNFTAGEKKFLSKFTVSGLWQMCYTEPGDLNMTCSNINYFPQEEYEPDPNDSTMAIPYAVTRSAGFFFFAGLLLIAGEVFCVLGHCTRRRRIFTFVYGVTFIISGLIVLIGLVIYISTFKSEVGGKLKPKSTFQPAIFTYQYGYSFLLVVTGFMVTEISGTCAIFLYIGWHRRHWMKKALQQKNALALTSGGSLVFPPAPPAPASLSNRRHLLQQRGGSDRYHAGGANNFNSLSRLEYLMYPNRQTPPLHHCLRHPYRAGVTGGGGMARRHSGSLLNLNVTSSSSAPDWDSIADGLTPPAPPVMACHRSKSQHDLHYSEAPVNPPWYTRDRHNNQQQHHPYQQQNMMQEHRQQQQFSPFRHRQQYPPAGSSVAPSISNNLRVGSSGRLCPSSDPSVDEYYIPRDVTCNTVSTLADVNSGDRSRDYSREFYPYHQQQSSGDHHQHHQYVGGDEEDDKFFDQLQHHHQQQQQRHNSGGTGVTNIRYHHQNSTGSIKESNVPSSGANSTIGVGGRQHHVASPPPPPPPNISRDFPSRDVLSKRTTPV